jgi:predicted ABC-type ATPase
MLYVRRDADGHHVLRDALSKVNRGVESGGHEINPTVIGRDFQHDVREMAREMSQLRSEDRLRRESRT